MPPPPLPTIWSLQTAQLLDSLSGHEAPLSCLAFSGATAGNNFLASGSWDKTVRVWDFLSAKGAIDTLRHGADVLALAFSPDGATLATATLDGALSLWDAKEAEQVATIDGRRDILGGRSALSKISRKNNAGGKCFRSLAFSADGSCVLAGGQSKYVCLYDVGERTLLRKYVLSSNVSLDGVRTQLNSKAMTDAGPEQDLLLDDDSEGEGQRLPGSRAPLRRSERVTKLAVRATCVRFSPDGRSWAAASTEGLVRRRDTHARHTRVASHRTCPARARILAHSESCPSSIRVGLWRDTWGTTPGSCRPGRASLLSRAPSSPHARARSKILRPYDILSPPNGGACNLIRAHATPRRPRAISPQSIASPATSLARTRTHTHTHTRTHTHAHAHTDGHTLSPLSPPQLLYALDETLQFDPTGLELSTTPAAVHEAVEARQWSRALPMALCLNEEGLIRATWQRVPPAEVGLVARELPLPYLPRLLRFLSVELDSSRHLHAVLLWAHALMVAHAQKMRDAPTAYEVPLRALHKGARLRYDELSRVCNGNLFSLQFLIDQLQTVADAAASEVAATADAAIAEAEATTTQAPRPNGTAGSSSDKASGSKASSSSKASNGKASSRKADEPSTSEKEGPPSKRVRSSPRAGPTEAPAEKPPPTRLRGSARLATK